MGRFQVTLTGYQSQLDSAQHYIKVKLDGGSLPTPPSQQGMAGQYGNVMEVKVYIPNEQVGR